MFNGESFVTFKTTKPMQKVISTIEDTLQRLGKVQINNRGSISISPKDTFQTFLVDTTIAGEMKKGKTADEFIVTLHYKCAPSAVTWIIAAVGTVMFCFGFLVLLVPVVTKSNLGTESEKCLHEIEGALGTSEGQVSSIEGRVNTPQQPQQVPALELQPTSPPQEWLGWTVLKGAASIAGKVVLGVIGFAVYSALKPDEKTCPYCVRKIPYTAFRCPYCTSDQPY